MIKNKYKKYILAILISLSTLIHGCGGSDNSRMLPNEPSASQSESSSTISKINQAEADADKNRYENAIYGKTTYQ